MHALIVDDSKPDRDALRGMLERVTGIQSIEESNCLDCARSKLTESAVDLVFLDIEVGRENGFSLLEEIGKTRRVIFTTVHSGRGGDAFDADAVDYIVKPVTEDRLIRALNRAAASFGRPTGPLTRIPVHRSGSARHYLAMESIAAVFAEGNYSRVRSGPTIYLDHRRLREWQNLLSDFPVERLDRSTLLRIDLVESVQPHGVGALVYLFHFDVPVELGRAGAERLREILEHSPKR
ncbi:MAG: LytR/AlgR family response regulator transcription factor [Verrucomicrobiota bacterium]